MNTWRLALRFVTLLVGGVAFVVALVSVALPIWLRTPYGHRAVERVLTDLLNERVPGTIAVGHLSGSVVGGLRIDDVTARNPRGEVIGHADRVSVRWRPLALVRHLELDKVTVDRPVIAIDRGTIRVPPEQPGKRPKKTVTIRQITAQDGLVSWRSVTFDHVSASASLNTSTGLDLHAAAGSSAGAAVHASGEVGWVGRPVFVDTPFKIDEPDRLRGTGRFFYSQGRLEVRVEELTVHVPAETKLVGGRGLLRIRGLVEGTPDHLSTVADATQSGRDLELRANVDVAARSGTVDARLDGLLARPVHLHARGSLQHGALRIPAIHAAIGRSRVDGSGELRGRVVRASVAVVLLPSEARLLALRPAAPIVAHVDLDGPVRRLRVGARARSDPARVRVRAQCDLANRRGRAEVVGSHVQPARLIAGAAPITVSGAVTIDGRWVQHAFIGGARISRGAVSVSGRDFARLSGSADVRLARAGEVDIHGLSGRLVGRHRQPYIGTRGRLRWTRERVAFVGATVTVAGNRFVGDASYTRARTPFGAAHLSARLDEITLSPDGVADLLRPLHYRPAAALRGRGWLDGTVDDFTFHVVAATELGQGSLSCRLRRAADRLDLTDAEARLGESYARGAALLQHGRLTARLDELLLQPAMVRRLMPKLDPAWPVRLRGAADGPLDAIDFTVAIDGGPSTATLYGRIAAHQRRFQLVGQLDTVDLDMFHKSDKRVRSTLQLAADGRFANGGVVGTLTARDVRGYLLESPYYRGMVDARFYGRSFEIIRARADLPGARIAAHGHGGYDRGFRIGYGVVVTNPLALRHVSYTVRAVLGITTLLPGRTVVGTVEKAPGGAIRHTYHVVPPGISQLQLLYRVMKGRPPSRDDN